MQLRTVIVAVALIGCESGPEMVGPPDAATGSPLRMRGGDPCSPIGLAKCSLLDGAMFVCERNVATLYDSCHGPATCKEDAGLVFCDFSGNVTGQACPSILAGRAQCGRGPDGGLTKAVQCNDDGGFNVLACDRGCYVDAGLVWCRP